ncbi:hypothetical protein GOBAR_AA34636 [Gossypium barbadense]|uniref:RPW8 domain-containing protein n=1 Tax=Gossypium barbadense TaxID=3634 RepID=A0A2P5W4M3_GOSBA|nr:hypothetical protein GOBAR_AA34636 [Gossypium barbadense]
MAFNYFFAGEIAMELFKQLIAISRKSCLCKSSVDNLISSIQVLLLIINEIKYSGVELPTLCGGLELACKVLPSSRWNVYKNLQLARKMEKLEKQVERFLSRPMQAHLLADVHHMRFETVERFDRLEGRLEQRLSSIKIGARGWVEEDEASAGIVGGVVIRDDLNVVGIWGIRGSSKTTLANEILTKSNKNILTLVKDARSGDAYSSYHVIYVTQHDVLRNLRLLMPIRDTKLSRDWGRNTNLPFNAQIILVHIGEMREMDWYRMEFPKAKVVILNFASNEYFLPHFVDDMLYLRATLLNFSVFINLTNLWSLWLEKVLVPELSNTTAPLRNLRKLSTVFYKVNNNFNLSVLDLPQIFPCLTEFVIDHYNYLVKLPESICKVNLLQNLSITSCHRLSELPVGFGLFKKLQILRLYACLELKVLPLSIGELLRLKFLAISQCVNLRSLPREICKFASLEIIDMREFMLLNLKSLRRVIYDDEVAEKWYSLD